MSGIAFLLVWTHTINPINSYNIDVDMTLRQSHKISTCSEPGSCPTQWPYGNDTDAFWLRPGKSPDGNQTCPWIDLIEASGRVTGIFTIPIMKCIFDFPMKSLRTDSVKKVFGTFP